MTDGDSTTQDGNRNDRPERPDPRGRRLVVARLWLDGLLTPAEQVTVSVAPNGSSWQVSATLLRLDPFSRTYGLSMQLEDGRALHGRVRMVAAQDGNVVFEGTEAPEGGWV